MSETYILRQGMGFFSAGTYSNPVESHEAGETFREIWCRCTGAGHVYGSRVNVQVSNAAATSSNAIRAELDFTHTSGHAVGGGSAIHAAADIGSTNTGHAGLLSGLNASIIVPADTRSMQGTYAALSLQTQIGANNTMPALSTSFIYAADASSVKAPAFLHWGQAEAAGTGVVDEAVTGGAAAMSLAVNINGVMGYIPIHAATA